MKLRTRLLVVISVLVLAFALCAAVYADEECSHSWDSSTGICTKCGEYCDHSDYKLNPYSDTMHKKVCNICGKDVADLSHTVSGYTPVDESTHTKKCTGCNASIKEKHTYSSGKCSFCGYTCPHGKWGYNAAGDVICWYCGTECSHSSGFTYKSYDATQHYKVCKTCKMIVGDYIDHTFVNGVCSDCDYECKHSMGASTVKAAKNSTCYEAGNKIVNKCNICAALIDSSKNVITVSADAYTAEGGAGYIAPLEHAVGTSVDMVEPACETVGCKPYVQCANCKDYYTDSSWTEKIGSTATELYNWKQGDGQIAALGHTEAIDDGFEPTCTEIGQTDETYCSVCGKILVGRKDIEPYGHYLADYISNYDATCTEDGTKTAICKNGCGYSETVVDEGSALGHSFGGWIVVVQPTESSNGTQIRVCSRCAETETESIPAGSASQETSILTVDGEYVPADISVSEPDEDGKVIITVTPVFDDTFFGEPSTNVQLILTPEVLQSFAEQNAKAVLLASPETGMFVKIDMDALTAGIEQNGFDAIIVSIDQEQEIASLDAYSFGSVYNFGFVSVRTLTGTETEELDATSDPVSVCFRTVDSKDSSIYYINDETDDAAECEVTSVLDEANDDFYAETAYIGTGIYVMTGC